MRIRIALEIRQVAKGECYQGDLAIGNKTFGFELRFAVPIPQLIGAEQPDDLKKIRALYRIAVRKSGLPIELTDNEYEIFYCLLVPFTVDFFQNLEDNAEQLAFMASLCARANGLSPGTPGMCIRTSADFAPEVCNLLCAPKFGVALPA